MCFNRDIQPILASHCGMCHNGISDRGGDKNFTTYEGVMKNVSKGNPTTSSLYTSLNNGMPPYDNYPPTQDQRTMIYAWIKQGADTICH